MQCNTIQYNAMLYYTMQYNTMQYNIKQNYIQYNTHTFITIVWIDIRQPWYNGSHEHIIPQVKKAEPDDMVNVWPGENTFLQTCDWMFLFLM